MKSFTIDLRTARAIDDDGNAVDMEFGLGTAVRINGRAHLATEFDMQDGGLHFTAVPAEAWQTHAVDCA